MVHRGAREAPRARRVHGRRQVDGRRAGRRADGAAVRRPRRADRAAPRADPRALRGAARPSSGASRRDARRGAGRAGVRDRAGRRRRALAADPRAAARARFHRLPRRGRGDGLEARARLEPARWRSTRKISASSTVAAGDLRRGGGRGRGERRRTFSSRPSASASAASVERRTARSRSSPTSASLELHPPPVERPRSTGFRRRAAKTSRRRRAALGRAGDWAVTARSSPSAAARRPMSPASPPRRTCAGCRWIAVPTTLTGQVDAGDRREDRRQHGRGQEPRRRLPLPARGRHRSRVSSPRSPSGSGAPAWPRWSRRGCSRARRSGRSPRRSMIHACAAYKAGDRPLRSLRDGGTPGLAQPRAHVCPRARGRLRLRRLARRGRRARAARRAAALRAADGRPSRRSFGPSPSRPTSTRAWAALKRDKKGEGVFVLLEAPGKPVVTTVPDADARAALEALIRR